MLRLVQRLGGHIEHITKQYPLLYRPIPSLHRPFDRFATLNIRMASSAPQPVESTAQSNNPAAQISSQATGEQPAAVPAGSQQPKQPKKDKKPKKDAGDLAAGMNALELDPKPAFFDSRMQLFNQLKKEQDEMIAGQFPIRVKLSSPHYDPSTCIATCT